MNDVHRFLRACGNCPFAHGGQVRSAHDVRNQSDYNLVLFAVAGF
jgi:hypothetical protein